MLSSTHKGKRDSQESPLPPPASLTCCLTHHQALFTFEFPNLPQIPLLHFSVRVPILPDLPRVMNLGFKSAGGLAFGSESSRETIFPLYSVNRSKWADLRVSPLHCRPVSCGVSPSGPELSVATSC